MYKKKNTTTIIYRKYIHDMSNKPKDTRLSQRQEDFSYIQETSIEQQHINKDVEEVQDESTESEYVNNTSAWDDIYKDTPIPKQHTQKDFRTAFPYDDQLSIQQEEQLDEDDININTVKKSNSNNEIIEEINTTNKKRTVTILEPIDMLKNIKVVHDTWIMGIQEYCLQAYQYYVWKYVCTFFEKLKISNTTIETLLSILCDEEFIPPWLQEILYIYSSVEQKLIIFSLLEWYKQTIISIPIEDTCEDNLLMYEMILRTILQRTLYFVLSVESIFSSDTSNTTVASNTSTSSIKSSKEYDTNYNRLQNNLNNIQYIRKEWKCKQEENYISLKYREKIQSRQITYNKKNTIDDILSTIPLTQNNVSRIEEFLVDIIKCVVHTNDEKQPSRLGKQFRKQYNISSNETKINSKIMKSTWKKIYLHGQKVLLQYVPLILKFQSYHVCIYNLNIEQNIQNIDEIINTSTTNTTINNISSDDIFSRATRYVYGRTSRLQKDDILNTNQINIKTLHVGKILIEMLQECAEKWLQIRKQQQQQRWNKIKDTSKIIESLKIYIYITSNIWIDTRLFSCVEYTQNILSIFCNLLEYIKLPQDELLQRAQCTGTQQLQWDVPEHSHGILCITYDGSIWYQQQQTFHTILLRVCSQQVPRRPNDTEMSTLLRSANRGVIRGGISNSKQTVDLPLSTLITVIPAQLSILGITQGPMFFQLYDEGVSAQIAVTLANEEGQLIGQQYLQRLIMLYLWMLGKDVQNSVVSQQLQTLLRPLMLAAQQRLLDGKQQVPTAAVTVPVIPTSPQRLKTPPRVTTASRITATTTPTHTPTHTPSQPTVTRIENEIISREIKTETSGEITKTPQYPEWLRASTPLEEAILGVLLCIQQWDPCFVQERVLVPLLNLNDTTNIATAISLACQRSQLIIFYGRLALVYIPIPLGINISTTQVLEILIQRYFEKIPKLFTTLSNGFITKIPIDEQIHLSVLRTVIVQLPLQRNERIRLRKNIKCMESIGKYIGNIFKTSDIIEKEKNTTFVRNYGISSNTKLLYNSQYCAYALCIQSQSYIWPNNQKRRQVIENVCRGIQHCSRSVRISCSTLLGLLVLHLGGTTKAKSTSTSKVVTSSNITNDNDIDTDDDDEDDDDINSNSLVQHTLCHMLLKSTPISPINNNSNIDETVTIDTNTPKYFEKEQSQIVTCEKDKNRWKYLYPETAAHVLDCPTILLLLQEFERVQMLWQLALDTILKDTHIQSIVKALKGQIKQNWNFIEGCLLYGQISYNINIRSRVWICQTLLHQLSMRFITIYKEYYMYIQDNDINFLPPTQSIAYLIAKYVYDIINIDDTVTDVTCTINKNNNKLPTEIVKTRILNIDTSTNDIGFEIFTAEPTFLEYQHWRSSLQRCNIHIDIKDNEYVQKNQIPKLYDDTIVLRLFHMLYKRTILTSIAYELGYQCDMYVWKTLNIKDIPLERRYWRPCIVHYNEDGIKKVLKSVSPIASQQYIQQQLCYQCNSLYNTISNNNNNIRKEISNTIPLGCQNSNCIFIKNIKDTWIVQKMNNYSERIMKVLIILSTQPQHICNEPYNCILSLPSQLKTRIPNVQRQLDDNIELKTILNNEKYQNINNQSENSQLRPEEIVALLYSAQEDILDDIYIRLTMIVPRPYILYSSYLIYDTTNVYNRQFMLLYNIFNKKNIIFGRTVEKQNIPSSSPSSSIQNDINDEEIIEQIIRIQSSVQWISIPLLLFGLYNLEIQQLGDSAIDIYSGMGYSSIYKWEEYNQNKLLDDKINLLSEECTPLQIGMLQHTSQQPAININGNQKKFNISSQINRDEKFLTYFYQKLQQIYSRTIVFVPRKLFIINLNIRYRYCTFQGKWQAWYINGGNKQLNKYNYLYISKKYILQQIRTLNYYECINTEVQEQISYLETHRRKATTSSILPREDELYTQCYTEYVNQSYISSTITTKDIIISKNNNTKDIFDIPNTKQIYTQMDITLRRLCFRVIQSWCGININDCSIIENDTIEQQELSMYTLSELLEGNVFDEEVLQDMRILLDIRIRKDNINTITNNTIIKWKGYVIPWIYTLQYKTNKKIQYKIGQDGLAHQLQKNRYLFNSCLEISLARTQYTIEMKDTTMQIGEQIALEQCKRQRYCEHQCIQLYDEFCISIKNLRRLLLKEKDNLNIIQPLLTTKSTRYSLQYYNQDSNQIKNYDEQKEYCIKEIYQLKDKVLNEIIQLIKLFEEFRRNSLLQNMVAICLYRLNHIHISERSSIVYLQRIQQPFTMDEDQYRRCKYNNNDIYEYNLKTLINRPLLYTITKVYKLIQDTNIQDIDIQDNDNINWKWRIPQDPCTGICPVSDISGIQQQQFWCLRVNNDMPTISIDLQLCMLKILQKQNWDMDIGILYLFNIQQGRIYVSIDNTNNDNTIIKSSSLLYKEIQKKRNGGIWQCVLSSKDLRWEDILYNLQKYTENVIEKYSSTIYIEEQQNMWKSILGNSLWDTIRKNNLSFIINWIIQYIGKENFNTFGQQRSVRQVQQCGVRIDPLYVLNNLCIELSPFGKYIHYWWDTLYTNDDITITTTLDTNIAVDTNSTVDTNIAVDNKLILDTYKDLQRQKEEEKLIQEESTMIQNHENQHWIEKYRRIVTIALGEISIENIKLERWYIYQQSCVECSIEWQLVLQTGNDKEDNLNIDILIELCNISQLQQLCEDNSIYKKTRKVWASQQQVHILESYNIIYANNINFHELIENLCKVQVSNILIPITNITYDIYNLQQDPVKQIQTSSKVDGIEIQKENLLNNIDKWSISNRVNMLIPEWIIVSFKMQQWLGIDKYNTKQQIQLYNITQRLGLKKVAILLNIEYKNQQKEIEIINLQIQINILWYKQWNHWYLCKKQFVQIFWYTLLNQCVLIPTDKNIIDSTIYNNIILKKISIYNTNNQEQQYKSILYIINNLEQQEMIQEYEPLIWKQQQYSNTKDISTFRIPDIFLQYQKEDTITNKDIIILSNQWQCSIQQKRVQRVPLRFFTTSLVCSKILLCSLDIIEYNDINTILLQDNKQQQKKLYKDLNINDETNDILINWDKINSNTIDKYDMVSIQKELILQVIKYNKEQKQEELLQDILQWLISIILLQRKTTNIKQHEMCLKWLSWILQISDNENILICKENDYLPIYKYLLQYIQGTKISMDIKAMLLINLQNFWKLKYVNNETNDDIYTNKIILNNNIEQPDTSIAIYDDLLKMCHKFYSTQHKSQEGFQWPLGSAFPASNTVYQEDKENNEIL